MQQQKMKIGGWLLAFFIMQICFAVWMLFGFPDSLRTLIESRGLEMVSGATSMLTMVCYSIFIIISMLHVILKNNKFLKLFQLAGAVALIGNLTTFILKVVIYYQDYNTFTLASINFNSNYYWILFVMALFWTLFWSVYFVKSSRVITYMEGREYIDKALFFQKSESPDWFVPQQKPVNQAPEAYYQAPEAYYQAPEVAPFEQSPPPPQGQPMPFEQAVYTPEQAAIPQPVYPVPPEPTAFPPQGQPINPPQQNYPPNV